MPGNFPGHVSLLQSQAAAELLSVQVDIWDLKRTMFSWTEMLKQSPVNLLSVSKMADRMQGRKIVEGCLLRGSTQPHSSEFRKSRNKLSKNAPMHYYLEVIGAKTAHLD